MTEQTFLIGIAIAIILFIIYDKSVNKTKGR